MGRTWSYQIFPCSIKVVKIRNNGANVLKYYVELIA